MEYLMWIFVLTILLAIGTNGQRSTVTSTTTITVTKTTTFYISTYAVCASVTTEVSSSVTACRRRRQYWIDVPVYIALDEDVDEQLNQFFIHPSNTYQVEPTVSPGLAFKNDDEEDDENSSHLPSFGIPPRPDAGPSLQGSLLTPFGYSDDDVTSETRSPEPVGFAVIANAINNALIALGLANPTTFVTDTSTLLKSTTMKTTTSTKTIFLSGCSPSPFPFSTCAAKPR